MLKAFWRFLFDVCLMIGAKHLALRFLLMSLETTNVYTPVINLKNMSPITIYQSQGDMKMIYEDKKLFVELGNLYANDIN